MKKDLQIEKVALLSAFKQNRQTILECARAWPPDRVDEIFLGSWSLLDLLAHLAGWDEANLEAISALQSGKLPEFYAHKDADWRSYNALLVKKYRRPTLGEQLALVRVSFGKVIEALTQMGVDEFFRDFGVRYKGYKVIISRLVESELHDEVVHTTELLAWLVGEP